MDISINGNWHFNVTRAVIQGGSIEITKQTDAVHSTQVREQVGEFSHLVIIPDHNAPDHLGNTGQPQETGQPT